MFNFEGQYDKSIVLIKDKVKKDLLAKHEESFNKDEFIKIVADEFYRYITEDRKKFKHKITHSYPLLGFLKSDTIDGSEFPSFQNEYLKQLISKKIKETFKTKKSELKLEQFFKVMKLLDINGLFTAFGFIEGSEELLQKIEKVDNKDLAKRMRTTLILAKENIGIDYEKIKAEIGWEVKQTVDKYNVQIQQIWQNSDAWKMLSCQSEQIKKILGGKIMGLPFHEVGGLGLDLIESSDTSQVKSLELDLVAANQMIEDCENQLAELQRREYETKQEENSYQTTITFSDKMNGEFVPFKESGELRKPQENSKKFDEKLFYSLGSKILQGSQIQSLNVILEKIEKEQSLSPQQVILVLGVFDQKAYLTLENIIESIFPKPSAKEERAPTINFGKF